LQNDKFQETSTGLLGTTQSLALVVMGVAAVAPVVISKSIGKRNILDINSGNGRIWWTFL
jgi:hypothetical protein